MVHVLTTSQRGVTARTVSGGTTYYTRDPQGHVIGQHGFVGTGYYYTDRLSSTIALMGSSGTATSTFSYAPYGATTQVTGTSNTPWRWTGQYYDTEGDGYYHQGARYNDTTGHFTQPDSLIGTIAKPNTINGFAYAGSDPINNTDPSGRDWGDVGNFAANICGAIGGALGGGAFGYAAGVAITGAALGIGIGLGGEFLAGSVLLGATGGAAAGAAGADVEWGEYETNNEED